MRMIVRLIGQGLVVVAIVVMALIGWAVFLPSSHPVLDRLGLLQPLQELGVPLAEDDSGARQGGGGFGSGAVQVMTAVIEEAEMRDRIAAIGTGEALSSVELRPEVSGRLAEVRVSAGEVVERGTVVARLDAAAEQIARDRAELMLDEALATQDRLERLRESGTATDVQIREAALGVRTAELAVRQAEFDLSRREIVAPITGWLGLIETEVGTQVGPDTTIARVDDRSMILVDFRVPERLVGRIAAGDALSVTLLSRPDVDLDGQVRAVDTRVDEASRTLRVLAQVANDDDRLRAGMAFSISLDLPGEHYPAVDPLAIQWGNDGAFVWVIRDDTAHRVPVRVVQRSGGLVLVRGDLEPDERVVREGVQSLREGTEVEDRARTPTGDGAESANAERDASET
ncbi:MAG: Membrane-fusion protein [Rhodobacteraceae bacterium HLUCCA12]|nr:MAG: Membrane-fusion protein [Rhodobacteraceae bacterium HLUCCA12]